MIFIDTREKLPLWDEDLDCSFKKLGVGDYTTDDLFGRAHAERKSPNDLYSSIIQGHGRFCNELVRATDNNIVLAVFVECSRNKFMSKKWRGGYLRKVSGGVLNKIIRTIEEKYGVRFIWCDDRDNMREQIIMWFDMQRKKFVVKR